MKIIKTMMDRNRNNKMLQLIIIEQKQANIKNLKQIQKKSFSQFIRLIPSFFSSSIFNFSQVNSQIINNSQIFYQFSTKQTKQSKSQMESQNKQISQTQSILQNGKHSEQQNQEQNPFADYQQQLFEQVVTHQKANLDTEEYRSRGTKRKQKLQQLRSQLKNPQLRRQRNRQRHRKQKQKLFKNLQGLKQQQIRPYLDQRKKRKQELKDKIKNAVEQEIGQTFLIDMAFQHRMNEKQNKSLAAQIQLIVKASKHIDTPPNVHLCGVKQGRVKDQLIKMKYQYWPIKCYQIPMEQCLKMDKFKGKKVYYLSPDAKQTLDTIQQNDIFIIGGLVDRTVIRDASLNRALQLGIQARSLPIRPFMKQRTCLNLDHIVTIVCKFIQIKDWKQAFSYGAPKRWKKQLESKEQKNNQNQQKQNNQWYKQNNWEKEDLNQCQIVQKQLQAKQEDNQIQKQVKQ